MKTLTNTMKKGIIISAFIFILFNTNAFPWLFANGSGTVFIQGYPNGTSTGYAGISSNKELTGNITIEMLIVEGAEYFFNANSDIQIILNIFEGQDTKNINYIRLIQTEKNALANITKARLTYERLIRVAEDTPYNLEMIESMRNFPYEDFLKEYRLNPHVFSIIRNYLENGDIIGTFKYSCDMFKSIEKLLLNFQVEISTYRLPEVSGFWKLNELCSETALFGSYIARIFSTIK